MKRAPRMTTRQRFRARRAYRRLGRTKTERYTALRETLSGYLARLHDQIAFSHLSPADGRNGPPAE